MALLISEADIASAWWTLGDQLLTHGKDIAPRDQNTKEILNVTFEVHDFSNNIIYSKIRDLNYRFMIAEWLWIMAGLEQVDILARYNSVMKQFSDDGHILSGAYGPRLMPQIPYILETLSRDSSSRQAAATIWTPSPKNSKDIPCTISMQWFIRKNKLHCTTNMRSSDFWLGLPYDFFTFSQISNYIAGQLGVRRGSLTMNLASSHLYEKNWDATFQMLNGGEVGWARSPAITENFPDEGHIITGLMSPEQEFSTGTIWDEYIKALKHGKEDAWEVLLELAEAD